MGKKKIPYNGVNIQIDEAQLNKFTNVQMFGLFSLDYGNMLANDKPLPELIEKTQFEGRDFYRLPNPGLYVCSNYYDHIRTGDHTKAKEVFFDNWNFWKQYITDGTCGNPMMHNGLVVYEYCFVCVIDEYQPTPDAPSLAMTMCLINTENDPNADPAENIFNTLIAIASPGSFSEKFYENKGKEVKDDSDKQD